MERLLAVSLLRILEQKPIVEIDEETLVLADIAQRALNRLEQTVTLHLKTRMGAKIATEFSKTLTSGRRTHDFAITADEAGAVGSPVKTRMSSQAPGVHAHDPRLLRETLCVAYLPTLHFGNDK